MAKMKILSDSRGGKTITLGAGSDFIFDPASHCLSLNARDKRTLGDRRVAMGHPVSSVDDKLLMPFLKNKDDFRSIMYLVFMLQGIHEEPEIRECRGKFCCRIP